MREASGVSWSASIRTKLICSFLLMIVFFAVLSLSSYYGERSLINRVNMLLAKNIALKEYGNRIDAILACLEKYLATANSDMLMRFHRESQRLEGEMGGALGNSRSEKNALLLQDIESLTRSFLTSANWAVQAKRGRDSNEYNRMFLETVRLGDYIKWGIDQVITQQLADDSRAYLVVSNRLKVVQRTGVILLSVALLFSLAITTWTTFRITEPLHDLADFAKSVTRGNLHARPHKIPSRQNDEIAVVTQAFNEMVATLVRYIGELENKSLLEKKLQEQELQNLTMKTFLREAELHALQSQINPHFLFNTLNACVHLASIEGADRTARFVDNLAHLLRYNLKKLGTPVTLREELDNLARYYQILQTRFGEGRFELELAVDQALTQILLPNLTLQPLVENALVHGLEDMERGGRITLTAGDAGDLVQVTIRDNGKGISQEKLEELNQQHEAGHTTGIGLRNVRERLRLFFNRDDLVSIESQEGIGTTITLLLPKTPRVEWEGTAHADTAG